MADREPSTRRAVRRRPRLVARRFGGAAILPVVFIITSLVALAVVPSLVNWRTEQIRRQYERVVEPARNNLNDVQVALALQLSALRGFVISGESRYLDTYRSAREDERSAMQSLRRLEPRLGPTVAVPLGELDAKIERWYERPTDAEMLEGTLEPAEYLERLPGEQALWEDLLDATSTLYDALGEREESLTDQTQAAEQVARLLTLFLVLLALLAVVTSARIGLRLAALTDETDKRRREAERMMERKARLIRGFGHNLKNPLGAIQGYAELLGEGVMNGLNKKQGEAVERIRGSLTAALGLIDDLVDLSRVEAGQLEIKRERTDVGELIATVTEASRAAAEGAELWLQVEVPADLPRPKTDARHVRQVLGNLLSNAIKYTPEGGTVTVRARAERAAARAWLAIDVSDTGPGIPPEEQEYVFLEFSRGRTETKVGHGLGLAISRHIARLLGGELTVRSEPGRGATFTLRLPVDDV